MNIGIVHLSDIHFKKDSNWIEDKAGKIAAAFRASDPTCGAYIVVVSGDIAFSGKVSEYCVAHSFFRSLRDALVESPSFGATSPDVHFIFVPGNHDCDFDSDTDTRRMGLNFFASDLSAVDPAGDLVQRCLDVQHNFFCFESAFNDTEPLKTTEQLFYKRQLDIQGFQLVFYCFNTAWSSRLKETQGQILFQVDSYTESVAEQAANRLQVAVFHHPYNWFPAANGRAFRKLVERSAEIVFTGHEHEGEVYAKAVLDAEEVQYFEGEVLQDSMATVSSFRAIFIDPNLMQQRISEFHWQGNLYAETEHGWGPIAQNHARPKTAFDNNEQFAALMRDVGTGFTHPRKVKGLEREDLFIYPELTRRNLHKKAAGNSMASAFIHSHEVLNEICQAKKVVLLGSDLSGKTTLSRSLYVDLKHKKNLIPILLSGESINSSMPDRIRHLLQDAITQQYSKTAVQQIEQIAPEAKALIIDDFDHCNLDTVKQRALVSAFGAMFGTVILIADEFFMVAEIGKDAEGLNAFADFQVCQIRDFGYYLRGKLIDKWVLLGNTGISSARQSEDQVAALERLVVQLLGNNLLPSTPLMILTILQAWESNTTHDMTSGAYGYLYETLILKALSTIELTPPEIDVVMTFLSRAAYELFKEQQGYFSGTDLRRLQGEYYAIYKSRLPDGFLDKLQAARVLQSTEGQYRFR